MDRRKLNTSCHFKETCKDAATHILSTWGVLDFRLSVGASVG